jgi:hypothetical protein
MSNLQAHIQLPVWKPTVSFLRLSCLLASATLECFAIAAGVLSSKVMTISSSTSHVLKTGLPSSSLSAYGQGSEGKTLGGESRSEINKSILRSIAQDKP